MNQFLNQIIDCPLPDNQYYKDVYNKRQIVIHHTVSNGNAQNVISSWQKTKEKVGVAFVIDREGKVFKAFSSAHCAHHLGTKEINNTILNKKFKKMKFNSRKLKLKIWNRKKMRFLKIIKMKNCF